MKAFGLAANVAEILFYAAVVAYLLRRWKR